MDKVNLKDAFGTFHDPWHPRVAGEVNDMQVKLARLEGEFIGTITTTRTSSFSW